MVHTRFEAKRSQKGTVMLHKKKLRLEEEKLRSHKLEVENKRLKKKMAEKVWWYFEYSFGVYFSPCFRDSGRVPKFSSMAPGKSGGTQTSHVPPEENMRSAGNLNNLRAEFSEKMSGIEREMSRTGCGGTLGYIFLFFISLEKNLDGQKKPIFPFCQKCSSLQLAQ